MACQLEAVGRETGTCTWVLASEDMVQGRGALKRHSVACNLWVEFLISSASG